MMQWFHSLFSYLNFNENFIYFIYFAFKWYTRYTSNFPIKIYFNVIKKKIIEPNGKGHAPMTLDRCWHWTNLVRPNVFPDTFSPIPFDIHSLQKAVTPKSIKHRISGTRRMVRFYDSLINITLNLRSHILYIILENISEKNVNIFCTK